MNKLTQHEPLRRVREGGILHFDVRFGCTGDMLTGALIGLGLDPAHVERALDAVGLDLLTMRLRDDDRGGLAGHRVFFIDPNGVPLQTPASRHIHNLGKPTAGSASRSSRRSTRAPVRGQRHTHADSSAQAESAIVLPLPGEPENPIREADTQSAHTPSVSSERTAQNLLRPEANVTFAELETLLGQSRLDVLPRAMAQRALRSLVRSYGQVVPADPHAIAFPGRVGLGFLCDIVSFTALIAALNPGQISSSPVGVSSAPNRSGMRGHEETVWPGPSPVVLEVLRQAPVLEHDFDYECTNPTGAALIGTFAHHFGRRASGSYSHHGVGLGAHHAPHRANCARASYAVQSEKPASQNDAQSSRVQQEWTVQVPHHIEIQQLSRKLEQMGAEDIGHSPKGARDSASSQEVRFTFAPGSEEDMTRFLFQKAQAIAVRTHDIMVHRPSRETATVMIGHGKKSIPLKLTIRYYEGECIGIDADETGLQAAALRSGTPKEVLRAEAIVKWQTLYPKAATNSPPTNEMNHD